MKRLFPLLLAAGCSGLVVPLYDDGPVLARHPGLRGRIVAADQVPPRASALPDDAAGVSVVGMVNHECDLPLSRADNLRQAFAMAGSLSMRTCLTQILVVRPSEGKVIVCDYYRYAEGGDERQNLALVADDLVVATELYDPERAPCAPEWEPIERYFSGSLDRAGLFASLKRSAPRR